MINPDNLDDNNNNNDCFHDSYDRLLSSTTSTSSSSSPSNYYYSSENDDADDDVMVINPNNCTSVRDYNIIGRLLPIPRFPIGVVNSYDVWISRPSSVDERRVRLLRQLGLVRDTDQLEASVSSVYDFRLRHENCVGNPVDCVDCVGLHNRCQVPIYDLSLTHENCVSNTDDCVGLDNKLQIPRHDNSIDGEAVEGVCLIKDLDNGKEFVVDEVREDGMWGKVKEVGTGRRLTMEEFEMCVGRSPIVQELMRRESVEGGNEDLEDRIENGNGSKLKKKGGWLRNIKNVASSVAGYKERRSSEDRDTGSERGGRRSSSATDDSQDVSFHGPERVRVRQYGKCCKDLTGLYRRQEIQAHNGSIWTMKFSLDGKYLASAGEDCVIRVWQVVLSDRKGDVLFDKQEDGNLNGSPDIGLASPKLDGQTEKKRRGRLSMSRKSTSLDHIVVPETLFGLSEKPFCTFEGHLDDVLDLSWSKSQHLLSSSMDKTVRLWQLSSKSCLKIFSHNDYVTCIQFNPVDDRYFISGSLDAKVRLWSIPDHQVVDWNDMHEMVTAACYTPDGQGALVGSYKGSCYLYDTTDNKLQQKSEINLQNKKKKTRHKKITGFQFVPGTSEVLITSADSRVRVVDGVELIHKFKGFHNTNRQISASVTSNGKYVVCASEDSQVYVWKHEGDSRASRNKTLTVTHSYEYFHCQDVSVAIPWPGKTDTCWGFEDGLSREPDDVSAVNHPPTPEDQINSSPFHGIISSAGNSYFFDRFSSTWPEEKLVLSKKNTGQHTSADFTNGSSPSKVGWGMVIVTAGLRGDIRTFQNFGLPVRL